MARKSCPVERGMRIIGGRWKGWIFWHPQDLVRFDELSCQLGGASKEMANQRQPVIVSRPTEKD